MAWTQPLPPPPPRSRRTAFAALLLLAALPALAVLLFWISLGGWRSRLHAPASPHPVVARGALADDERTTVDLFERTAPAVVYITNLAVRRDVFGLNAFEIPQGTGSGFIWDQSGYVVTNFHVIQGAQAAEVTLSDRTHFSARLAGYEADKDLAVLKIEAPSDKLRPIMVGSSHDLKVGQKVFAIGNPFGLDHTLTTGIISALGREIRAVTGRPIQGVIQTDAVINPGNSGGPLLDSAGRLIGVNTAIYSPPDNPTGTYIGIGFAVPVDTVNAIVPQLVSGGRVTRPGLGVRLADDRLVSAWGLEGALIVDVTPGSGAAAAGLQPTSRDRLGRVHLGDVIVAIDGQRVREADDVVRRLEGRKAGEQVIVRVQRGDRTQDVPVNVQSLP
jgi:S1-C subfamily serine protease